MRKLNYLLFWTVMLSTALAQSQNTQPPIDQDVPVNGVTISTTDSEIVGSLGIGIDIGSPSYGFDTMIMRENNLRMYFDDTSSSASFPNNDWGFEFNESGNGGANWFRVMDRTANTAPLTIEAGAGNSALYVDNAGNVGIGTNNPVVEIHNADGDSPTLRLEQNGTNGFTPQTWDIAGNETNFFIRDVTNSSRLPFRIRPGAPTSSIDIAANGSIGIETQTPNSNTSLDLGSTSKGLGLNQLDTAQRTTLGTALGTKAGVIVYDTDDNLVYVWDGAAWTSVGSDDQALTLNVNSLELEDGGTVDLSSYLDNTDDQALTLNVNSLELEDGGTVDLSSYLDNTDDQTLSLNVNSLELEDGGMVDLSGYLDNTDTQNIAGSALVGTDLTIGITGGTSETVDLSSLMNSGTDDQQLTLNANSLELEDGGSVDLSSYLDNTDEQTLGVNLDGNVLQIIISNGNLAFIDLTPIIQPVIDQNISQQVQIDDLISRMEFLEDCACQLDIDDFQVKPDRAYLFQNVPNPFDNTTEIQYFIPLTYSSGNIVISSTSGKILNNIGLTKIGEGSIVVDKNILSTGVYLYTLFVDGKKVDTKRMIVE